MSSFINFKNYKPMVANSSLIEQSSKFALTFDELQNQYSGNKKDFGSMNMDELLKNIWSNEETQSMTSNSNLGITGNSQKQGSLTLSRTVSQKKVDEVWKDLLKEDGGFIKDVDLIKEPTLGEMTLEEFLQRTGAITENDQTQGFKNVIQNQGFHQESVVTEGRNDNSHGVSVRSSKVQKLQKILPKQTAFDFRSSVTLVNNDQIGKVSINGKIDHAIKTDYYPSEFYQNSNFDASPSPPPPPPPYGGGHGRNRSGPSEKVVERRRKRMIKNRESAARSRARKQAYTLELEAEVAKLKEEIQKRQEAIMESQNFQIREKMKMCGSGRLCLRRTMTGPW